MVCQLVTVALATRFFRDRFPSRFMAFLFGGGANRDTSCPPNISTSKSQPDHVSSPSPTGFVFQLSLLRPSDPHHHQLQLQPSASRVASNHGAALAAAARRLWNEFGALTQWLGRASRPPVGQVTSVPRWDVTCYGFGWDG